MLETAFFVVILLLGASLVVYTFVTGISPMPTSRKVGFKVQDAVDEAVASMETLPQHACELGFGWGSLLVPTARRLPDLHWRGWERSPLPYWFTRVRVWAQLKPPHRTRITCIRGDFLLDDLRNADLILCYLYPGGMNALAEKLLRDHKSDGWLISHTFRLPGRQPRREYRADDLYQTPVYLYNLSDAPAKPIAGTVARPTNGPS